MTGLCGVLGESDQGADRMVADLRWTDAEATTEYTDRDIAVHGAFHTDAEADQPAVVEDGALIWVWGEVYGIDTEEGYRPRETRSGTATAYCQDLYEERGLSFVPSLNGTFVGLVYDPERQEASWFTDRLGTRSLYYCRPEAGTFVFSTRAQSLPLYPAVETDFDVEYLYEYFSLARVGGTNTPLQGVGELPPGSTTTVNLETGAMESESYWKPMYEPVDEPFSRLVDRFVDRLQTVLDERIDDDSEYGLLLSGGSDSRAVLAGLTEDVDLTTYHAAGWMSPEARAAERAAIVSGNDFRLLRRDRNYQQRALEAAPEIMNFHGRFDQAHVLEFAEELREDVDIVISGLYSDMLFKAGTFSSRQLPLGPVGALRLPAIERVKTLTEYVSRQGEVPAYLNTPPQLRTILEANIERQYGHIAHHGVRYRSLYELVTCGEYYPLSNDPDLFYHALTQSMPHWSPFLDNRLIDLALSVPLRHQVRRNVIKASVKALDPALARIRHGNTGVPLVYSFPIDYLWYQWHHFLRKHLPNQGPPGEHLGYGPWPNNHELIRQHDFVIKALQEHREVIKQLPFLNWEGAIECYREHLAGADKTVELYTLLSFLRMPITHRVANGFK